MLMLIGAVTACSPIHGSKSGYPDAAPVPSSSILLAQDKAADDDDYIRSRQQVIDINGSPVDTVFDFYRHAFPASDGWQPHRVRRAASLCLVNDSDRDRTMVLDVVPYEGDRVSSGPGRYLVLISRMGQAPRNPCGKAAAWIDIDLLRSSGEGSGARRLGPS